MEQRLLDVAISDLTEAQEQLLLIGRKTAIERVASFLLLQTRRPQPRTVLWPRIYLAMSRSDIADYLGMTVETISRTLTKLKACGAIAIPNIHEIDILDISHLEVLAQRPLLPRAFESGQQEERSPAENDSEQCGAADRTISQDAANCGFV
ncbi:MAG: helix-turn-helix domain-containing protein [Acetobacteraceae bacterium]